MAFKAGVRVGWCIIDVAGNAMDGRQKEDIDRAFIKAKAKGMSYTVTFRHPPEAEAQPVSFGASGAKAGANALSLVDMMQAAVDTVADKDTSGSAAETAATPKGRSGPADA